MTLFIPVLIVSYIKIVKIIFTNASFTVFFNDKLNNFYLAIQKIAKTALFDKLLEYIIPVEYWPAA